MKVKSVVRIPFTDVIDNESLGTKPKFWVRRPDDDHRWLFKEENRATGEDWAEVVVADLCDYLEIPHAIYELSIAEDASGGELRGVITKNIAVDGWELLHGNSLLGSQDAEYPEAGYRVQKHTLTAVHEVVRSLAAPRTATPEVQKTGATGIYAGYLFLDALVGNQDRHHENWGALVKRNRRELAPTFDHGASLARNLTDGERKERLTTKDHGRSIQHFAKSARSALYASLEASRVLSTHRAFLEFAKLANVRTSFWTKRLETLNERVIETVLDQIPSERLSELAREFTFELVCTNRQILIDYE